MGTVYARGKKLWVGFKDRDGKWVYRWSGFEVGQETQARAALEEIEKAIGDGAQPAFAGLPTVAQYAETWCSGRIAEGLSNALRERGRLRKYLGALGPMRIDRVERRHVRAWLQDLKAKTWQPKTGAPERLAPRTVRSTYGILHSMFESAVEVYIDVSPCRLKKRELPKKTDKNPAWRSTAVFTRHEVEQLISDERVPFDRRVTYALGALAGLRAGEVGALRWSALEERKPLSCLHVTASYNKDLNREQPPKSGYAREVPVPITLAALLAEWKLRGFAEQWGRAPAADDLVVPNSRATYRTDRNTMDGQRKDFPVLGIRHRRFHDLRRTFTSLARAGGADRDVLRWVTHGPEHEEMVDLYTSLPWPVLCDAVSRIKVGLLGAEVRELRAVAGQQAFLQAVLPRGENTMQRTEKSELMGVEAEGIEPASSLPRRSPPRAVTGGSAPVARGNRPMSSADRRSVVSQLRAIAERLQAGADPGDMALELDVVARLLRRR